MTLQEGMIAVCKTKARAILVAAESSYDCEETEEANAAFAHIAILARQILHAIQEPKDKITCWKCGAKIDYTDSEGKFIDDCPNCGTVLFL